MISVPLIVGRRAGSIRPHVLLLRIAEDGEAQPEGGERGADVVELRRVSGARRRLHLAAHEQDRRDDHDLAGEHVAPAEVGRDPAADQRAGGDRRAGDAADDPEGERALLALVVRGDQRHDRGHHDRRAEALDERPADRSTPRFGLSAVVSEPDAVDREADREDRSRPKMSPSFAPASINAAMTSV